MLPSGQTLPHILAHHLEATPDHTAVVLVTGSGEQHLSIRELLTGAWAYCGMYSESGVQAGDTVVDLLPPGADLLFAFLGGILLGAVPCILPFPTEKLDPVRYRENLIALMQVTHPAALVAEPGLASELRGTLPQDPALKAIIGSGGGDQAGAGGAAPERWEGLTRSPKDLALLQHSSGTTGLQKGVALSHSSILNQVSAYAPSLRLAPEDVIVSWLPLYHDMGLIAGFLLPLLTGIKLVLLSPFDWIRAPWVLMQAVSRHRGTLVWLPNFAFNLCADRIPDSRLKGLDLSSWRAVINCSEPMYANSHQMFSDRFLENGMKAQALTTCYAMAENVFAVTQGPVDKPVSIDKVDSEALARDGLAEPTSLGSRRVVEVVSAGPQLPNCSVRAIGKNGQEVGERQVGELALQSDCMLSGYFNRPDATDIALRESWFYTGDLGYIADGEVYITGRRKDLMIIGGKNVYPQDIEHLIDGVPGVNPGRAVVFGIADKELGTEQAVAIVEVNPRHPRTEQVLGLEIRRAVAAGSEITLRYVETVGERWLIKTSSGKLARAANREKFLAEQAGSRAGPEPSGDREPDVE
ncbi:MAG TPA: AMP-binding protein [Anaerolineales bacterium]|nr:AMP-binding protein [Anaerolineales bacterium]